MNKGFISCVIPVVRNDPFVMGCVESIKKSTYTNYEIIIVDEGRERSYQRNQGIKRAQGEFIIFLDSDMRVHPELFKNCIKIIEEKTAVYVPERIVTKGFFGYLRDWERQFYNGTLVDVVRFIRADRCPLFDEELHGVEDSDWERMIKDKRFVTSAYPFYHHDQVGLIKYLKKKAYYARCLNAYRRKNPADELLTMRYRCFQVFVEKGKWKRLLSRPDLAFLVALLLMARATIFFWQGWRYK